MNTSDKHLRMLATATLIRRFQEHCPLSELYEKAIRSYETLLDVIENSSTAKSIGEILHIPDSAIKKHAESIITILLNNKENNLFLAFGLQKDAPLTVVKKRWKRLIFIYHPDRYFHHAPDKSKKINELYAKIEEIVERDRSSGVSHLMREMSSHSKGKLTKRKSRTHMLWFVIGFVSIMIICSVLILLLI